MSPQTAVPRVRETFITVLKLHVMMLLRSEFEKGHEKENDQFVKHEAFYLLHVFCSLMNNVLRCFECSLAFYGRIVEPFSRLLGFCVLCKKKCVTIKTLYF